MKNEILSYSLILFLLLILTAGCREKYRLLSGSYSETGKAGINVYEFAVPGGRLNHISEINAGPNPSFFCFSESKDLVYVINEVEEFMGEKAGGLTTLKHSGNLEDLEKISEMPVPNGGPCYISASQDGNFLLIANYGGGSVAVVKLDEEGYPVKVTDTILYEPAGQKVSHAHMISFDPGGKRVYVTDLGLDRIMIYDLNVESGILIPLVRDGISFPEDTGPRHFAFSADGKYLYAIGELNNDITVFEVAENEGLLPVQTISTLSNSTGRTNYSADIHMSGNGKFLYATNRGDNVIANLKVDSEGKLSLPVNVSCGGDWPRNFTIDPSGKYLLVANQKSDHITVFEIDSRTGIAGKITGNMQLGAPACLKFDE